MKTISKKILVVVLLVGLSWALCSNVALAQLGQQIPNPWCQIPTFVNPMAPARGFATLLPGPSGPTAVIFVQPGIPSPSLASFILGHECGHHVRGHIIFNNLNPMAAPLYQPAEEYDADCHAARLLKSAGDIAGIQAALIDASQTPDPRFPIRVQNIMQCAQ